MPRPNVEILGMVENSQSSEGVVVIGKRFTLTHDDDIGHSFIEIILNNMHLIDDLTWVQASI